MLVILYYIIFSISFVYGMYFAITGLFGFKNYHKSMFSKHKPKYRFGIVIPTRNEEKVIGSLVQSLQKQNYPKDMYEIFVVPNNCTDDTEGAARRAGATIINCTVPVKFKADALKFTFHKLQSREDIDAFVIFDADNLVHPDFLARMNDALCEGVQVAQAFRDAKNMKDNWITGGYTLFYFVQNFFYNRARMNYAGSATINGTGFVMRKEVVKDGFNTVTITEDSEFTAQCAIRGIQVAFVEDAITYDEHPITFKETGNIACFDMVMMFLAPIMMLVSAALSVALVIFHFAGVELFDFFSYLYASGVIFFLVFYILSVVMNVFVVKYNHKKPRDIVTGILFFAIFLLSWIPINVVCLFKRTNNWEQINHHRSDVDLDKLLN